MASIVGSFVFTFVVYLTNQSKKVLIGLIITSLSGFIIFYYGLHQSNGQSMLMLGISLIGLTSFAIYGLAFEFIVMLTPHKGQSLTSGSINLWANALALLNYLINYFIPINTTKITIWSMIISLVLALVIFTFCVPTQKIIKGNYHRDSLLS